MLQNCNKLAADKQGNPQFSPDQAKSFSQFCVVTESQADTTDDDKRRHQTLGHSMLRIFFINKKPNSKLMTQERNSWQDL